MGKIKFGSNDASVENVVKSLSNQPIPVMEVSDVENSHLDDDPNLYMPRQVIDEVKLRDLKEHFDLHVGSLQNQILENKRNILSMNEVENKIISAIQISPMSGQIKYLKAAVDINHDMSFEKLKEHGERLVQLEEVKESQPIQIVKEIQVKESQIEYKVPKYVPMALILQSIAIIALILLK